MSSDSSLCLTAGVPRPRALNPLLGVLLLAAALHGQANVRHDAVSESIRPNNLVHPEDTPTAPLGTLGRVVLEGHGPLKLVLFPGFGLTDEVFAPFISRNRQRATMLCVTPAGWDGTPPPPMPPPGTSYAERTWSRAHEHAVWSLLNRLGWDRVVLVAHLDGLQHALRLAIEHPRAVSAVISVAGEPCREFGQPVSTELRASLIDTRMAESWFRSVDAATWAEGMGSAEWFSDDIELGTRLHAASLKPSIPTMVRGFCEKWAHDPRPEFRESGVPYLALLPDGEAYDRAEYRQFLESALVAPWESLEGLPNSRQQVLLGTRLGMLPGHTPAVSDALFRFLDDLEGAGDAGADGG